jgi:mannitol-1-phosphate/altronate dehydrogenase
MQQQSPTVPVPVTVLEELAALGRAITHFAEKFKQAQSYPDAVLSDEDFIKETETLRQAFVNLTDEETDALVTEAVKAARHLPSTS